MARAVTEPDEGSPDGMVMDVEVGLGERDWGEGLRHRRNLALGQWRSVGFGVVIAAAAVIGVLSVSLSQVIRIITWP